MDRHNAVQAVIFITEQLSQLVALKCVPEFPEGFGEIWSQAFIGFFGGQFQEDIQILLMVQDILPIGDLAFQKVDLLQGRLGSDLIIPEIVLERCFF